jgi:hypothetical protein
MQSHSSTPTSNTRNTLETVVPGKCGGLIPEFVRPADAVRLYGIGKSTLADWITRGLIRSHLVRRVGNTSGMRLVSTASLREFIEGHGRHQDSADALNP